MGYGFAGKIYEYHLPTSALPKPGRTELPQLRLLQPEDFDAAMDCQRRFAARNHGMVEKFDEEIRGLREDIQVRRVGYYGPEGQLRAMPHTAFRAPAKPTTPKTA